MTLAEKIQLFEEKLRIGKEFPFQMIGLEERQVLLISGLGRRLFDQGRFKEAGDIFFLLTVLDPEHYFYWVSLGMCEQNLENYEAAIVAYYTAICLGHRKPAICLYLAQCFYHLKEAKAALIFINYMNELGAPTPSTEEVYALAAQLKTELTQMENP